MYQGSHQHSTLGGMHLIMRLDGIKIIGDYLREQSTGSAEDGRPSHESSHPTTVMISSMKRIVMN